MEVGTRLLRDTLGLPDLTLDRAWVGLDTTLFLRFHNAADRLCALRAKRKLFSLLDKIFLEEDLT